MKKQTNCTTTELYHIHREKLLSLIYTRTRDWTIAEDILHDAFEKIERYCQQGGQCEYPKSYIYRVILNTVSDYFRARTVHQELESCSDILEGIQSHTLSFDVYACIDMFLQNTSYLNREAYTLVDLEQMSQIEVAKKLNIPLSTLKSRVQRTRKFLKEEFIACCERMELNIF